MIKKKMYSVGDDGSEKEVQFAIDLLPKEIILENILLVKDHTPCIVYNNVNGFQFTMLPDADIAGMESGEIGGEKVESV